MENYDIELKKKKKKDWINTQKLLIKIEILFSLKKKKERKKERNPIRIK